MNAAKLEFAKLLAQQHDPEYQRRYHLAVDRLQDALKGQPDLAAMVLEVTELRQRDVLFKAAECAMFLERQENLREALEALGVRFL